MMEYGSIQDSPLLENEHHTVEGSFKAAVFGFSDGLVTNLTLVLSMACATQTHNTVVLAGMAGLFAGASSMACGEWLSAQAERDSHRQELRTEAEHLQQIPETEAAHMKEILMSYGLSSNTSDAINRDVAALPLEDQVRFHGKFELGIDTDEDGSSPLKNALFMWIYFVIGAFIPVLPWFLTRQFEWALGGSLAASAVGMVATAVYQVRGHYQRLLGILGRQAGVTAVAIGFTVLFNYEFS
jgi:vacuolar iron transporter family protein